LTKETRQETIKLGQKFLELTKSNIRNLRQSGMKELQGGKKLGVDKDSLKKLENEVN
jgi:ribosome recycling factor